MFQREQPAPGQGFAPGRALGHLGLPLSPLARAQRGDCLAFLYEAQE